jgi:hypothetical protein
MNRLTAVVSALVLGTRVLQAQETNEVEQLKRQLRQMHETFERVQREQKQQIEALTQKLEALAGQEAAAAEKKKLETELAAELQKNQSAAATQAATAPAREAQLGTTGWSPAQPITVARAGSAYMNVSFDALVAAGGSTASDIDGGTQLGGHDPKQRGFTVQNLETTFDGKVDPYFRGQANIVLQIDPAGETTIEAEEAYLETMSLPWNLQVRAGQFFTEFGRLNPTHPHAWSFVDQPLVNGRFFGEDGLRSAGGRLSWLAPTPFYSELFFTMQNSQGGTAFSFRNDHEGKLFFGRPHDQGRVKNLGDLLFVPRYAASFDLSDSQTLVAGVSAAFGPNGSGADTDTQVYGADLYWKWKPANAQAGFPFVSWQTEAMLRRYAAGAFDGDATATPPLPALPAETLTDWGFYSQVLWGFKPRWVAGLRGDFVAPTETAAYETLLGRDPDRAQRWRLSPNLTWYPSEFSKLRLQYNYDDRRGIGVDHSVWLQFEFLLGAHAAHKF